MVRKGIPPRNEKITELFISRTNLLPSQQSQSGRPRSPSRSRSRSRRRSQSRPLGRRSFSSAFSSFFYRRGRGERASDEQAPSISSNSFFSLATFPATCSRFFFASATVTRRVLSRSSIGSVQKHFQQAGTRRFFSLELGSQIEIVIPVDVFFALPLPRFSSLSSPPPSLRLSFIETSAGCCLHSRIRSLSLSL